MGGFINWLRSILPLRRVTREQLEIVASTLSQDELEEIRYLLKVRKIRFSSGSFDTTLISKQDYLILAANSTNPRLIARVEALNKRLSLHGKAEVFRQFSASADETISSVIATSIIGMSAIKKAALLQLFAKEKFHILLLGDPSTGKTVILRSVSELAPISSFGLGSGTSKAGLTLAFSGKEMIKGILPLANKGIACIDELNLMRPVDRAGLLNAMEKGFITYDKGTSHLQVEAKVNVFASANPQGDKFVGRTVDVLKKQIPFEPALLSRFHLLFLLRRPDSAQFRQITEKIIRSEENSIKDGDKNFIREYVAFALTHEVEFDKSLSPLIQGFVDDVRKDEDKFLVEISPRMVVGIINLAKASARMELRKKVEKQDVLKALKIFDSALYIKKDELER